MNINAWTTVYVMMGFVVFNTVNVMNINAWTIVYVVMEFVVFNTVNSWILILYCLCYDGVCSF